MAKQIVEGVYKIVEVVGVSQTSWKTPESARSKRRPNRCGICASPK